jgi:hypothetical protein
MKSGGPSSSQWSIPEVLAQLRAKVGKGEPVAVQVFLHDDVSAEDLAELAEKIVSAAKQEVGKHAAAKVGRVHRLAKSFSVSADVDTLSAVANMPKVKTILPSEVPDILPRPVKAT